MINLVNAVDYKDTTFTLGSTASTAALFGVKFVPLYNVSLNDVFVGDVITDPTSVQLLNSSLVMIAYSNSSTDIGTELQFVFTTPPNLTAGHAYYVVTYNNGETYNFKHNEPNAVYPLVRNHTNYTSGFQNPTEISNGCYSITAINTTRVLVDTTKPEWSLNSTNSTSNGTSILHNLKWTDETALAGYIFSFDNGTGTFINDSFVSMIGLSNWSNVSKIVNTTIGSTIRWMVYTNDSSNNQNNTGILTYITTPDLSGLIINSPTTSLPLNVTNGQNITITFNLSKSDGINVTTGVTMNNVTINNNLSSIVYTPEIPAYNTTLLSEDWEAGSINTTKWNVTASGYAINTNQKYAGSYSISLGSSLSNKYFWANYNQAPLDTTNCDAIYVSYWFRDDDLDATDIEFSFRDSGGTFDTIAQDNAVTEDTWEYRIVKTTEAQYKHSTFSIRWGDDTGSGENHWVDDIEVICEKTAIPAIQQFAYVPNIGWQINVTVPADSGGYKDLFLNATYDRNVYNDTQINAINYTTLAPPVDSCTCPSANTNWTISMTDYCNITSACNIGTGNLSFTGAGYCNISNTITANKRGAFNLTNGATIYLYKSGGIINLA